ncbi:MAG: methionyl-tRNA formyltransferase [Deltaproteobacteria bacterium]|nr:methionyl-tRNA formyltransferase [Deltaproteobacteria bacterium]
MGTPDFAVPLVEAASTLGELVAVVTQPDKPKGRGNELAAPPVKEWALAHGIPVWQPVKIKTGEFEAQLRAVQPDVAVVAAYGRILPKGVLDAPRLGCVNVHASLLPKLRGAAPIQWAIANGESETGVCLMQMDEGLDTGAVLARRAIPIAADETGGSLFDKLSVLGRELLVAELPRFLKGELTPVPQDHAKHTLAPIIEKSNGELDFTKPAIELERRVRAFDPWPGTFTRVDGKLLKVLKARVVDGSGAPGTVLRAGAEGLVVACGQGALAVEELQLEGRKRMRAADFLAGFKVEMGKKLGT